MVIERVGIAGFRGYSGAELVRLLEGHPRVRPVLLEHRGDTAEFAPAGRNGAPERIAAHAEAVRAAALSAVFLATPAEVSLELAPALLASGIRVIDLSGAFRLRTPESYARWYRAGHPAPQLLAEAVYGLPEFFRELIPGARLIANPGCYPTAANLAIRPLVRAGIPDRAAGIVCDAKSGVSGAGRKPALHTSFCEAAENLSAYAVLEHRHVPEILMVSGLEEAELSFTAQLIPVERGILETVYFRSAKLRSAEDLHALYREAYRAEPFLRLYPLGHLPDLRGVQRTNYCDLGVKFDASTGRGVVVSAIDNLGKGAAGQAVQNMNLMLGFEETAGLP